MNISLYLQSKIKTALEKLSTELDINSIVIERSKDPVHGDYATNVAMQLSKILKKNPRQIATELVEALDKTDIEKVCVKA